MSAVPPGHGGLPARTATKALFVAVAGVLLDPAPAPGRLAGLRSGTGAALRLLDRLDYRLVVLAPCTPDRRQSQCVAPARLADLLFRERIAVAGVCRCGAAGVYADAPADPHADAPAEAPADAPADAPAAAASSTQCHHCAPAPGLLLRAAREHGIALAASWLLASNAQHLHAGRQAGCRTLLVDAGGQDAATGSGSWTAPPAGPDGAPAAWRARDMFDAALAIARADAAC